MPSLAPQNRYVHHSLVELLLFACRVSKIPIDTPLRRRARHSARMLSSVNVDDNELEAYLTSIHTDAKDFDRAAVGKRMPLSRSLPPVCKELVFTSPKFGLVFQRELDAFGYKPLIMVQSISYASPAAGLIGTGDHLIAVDGKSVVYVHEWEHPVSRMLYVTAACLVTALAPFTQERPVPRACCSSDVSIRAGIIWTAPKPHVPARSCRTGRNSGLLGRRQQR
jgi:hypothetical protein